MISDEFRRLYLPPAGRPRWKARPSLDWDLTYLFWGRRRYGENPVPLSCREGWTYLVILSGSPTFFFREGRPRRADPGMGIIFHPDCVRGVRDAAGRSCTVLGWIWKSQPNHALVQPGPGGYIRTAFTPERLHRLEKIHASCRREVAAPGAFSSLALQKSKLELDLCFLESLEKSEAASQESRIQLAVDFIRHNPGVLDPVQRLCEYLQISPATLKRLFQKYLGQSPQAFALEQRMLLARERLATGRMLVKEVAGELGYKHPNDFSRAYHRFFSRRPDSE